METRFLTYESKMREKQSPLNNQHLQFHIDHTPLGYIQWNRQFQLETWSVQAERILGWSVEEVYGTSIEDSPLVYKEDTGMAKQAILEVLENGQESFKLIVRNVTKSGKILHCEWYNSVLRDHHGKMVSILSFINDISERIAYEKAVKDLEKRNYELNNFAYKVSHDLRAPLCSVKGLIGLMKSDNDPASSSSYLEMIEGSVERLDQFILNVLCHARVTNSKVSTNKINFEEIINATFLELSYMPSFNRVKKHVKVGIENFYSDENLMKEILKNLISNGIKYQDEMKEGSFIEISVNGDAKKVVIVYKDNGLGIEKEQVPKIFDMFYRASVQSIGSGIGLYIVKQAIKKMQGKIEVQSKLNEGTIFRVILPNKVGSKENSN